MILYPGTYLFTCPCGLPYGPIRIKAKEKVQNYCFRCKESKGKFIKLMENQILDFSHNWNNKLNCKAFTTLRLRNERKYYPGACFEIRLKGICKGTATVRAVSYYKLDKLNDYVSLLDTGYPSAECRKIIMEMYKNKPFIDWFTQDLAFVLLAYEEKKEMENLFT